MQQAGGSGVGPGGVGPGGAGRGGPTPEQMEGQRKQAEAREEQRRLILKQVLTPEASERLANVALVKQEKARQVENYIIGAAQSGKLGGKVTEDQLKDLLTQVTEQSRPKVVITRRRNMAFDSDDDDDDDDW